MRKFLFVVMVIVGVLCLGLIMVGAAIKHGLPEAYHILAVVVLAISVTLAALGLVEREP
jgi:hypothetical protein